MLIAIGSTDILFALDSIPAVFGVTAEPYIVFVANAFALLGLRALFFLVKGLLDRLVYLSTGLAVILAFIGDQAHAALGARPVAGRPGDLHQRLAVVIVVVLAITTVASLIKSRRDPTAVAHAGSLRGHHAAGSRAGTTAPAELTRRPKSGALSAGRAALAPALRPAPPGAVAV